MKAIQLTAPKHFRLLDVEPPGPPGPGEALVRVHRVGVCGSDVSGYLGEMPFFSYPRIPGHELGVEVLEVGEGVTNVRPGDRCSVEPYMNCGRCFACREGAGNCCQKLQVLGVHTDGGLRERMLVRADKLHPSDRLSFDQLALVETLAIGCHCAERAAPKPGDVVLVIGAGPIGLSVIEFLRLKQARVFVADISEQRLRFCREKWSDVETVRVGGSVTGLDVLRDRTGGDLAKVVVDATGNSASMAAALDYVAHSGRLVYVGITTDEIRFPHPKFHVRETTLLASRNAMPSDFQLIIRAIEEGRIDTDPWITHRTTFERLADDFPTYTQRDSGVLKAMIEVDA